MTTLAPTAGPTPWPMPWRQALPPLVMLLSTLLLLYRDTAIEMVATWSRSDTFAHAFLVPPIVAWLIWRDRERLSVVLPRPAGWALVLLAGAGLLWLIGDLGAANSASQLAFTALLVAAVPAVIGTAATRALLFPLCFLFFAVPIGDFMMPQLMVWTADFTVLALRLSGIPVYREGLEFVIPSGIWAVAEACSGVRYLIASVMVGTLFAYLNFRSLRRRLVFVGVSFLVPIVANWVRAYLIVLLGHLSSNRIAVGVDHLIYGWIFFGVVIFLMFMIGVRWAEPLPAAAIAAGDVVIPHRAAATAPARAPRHGHTGAAWAVAAAAAGLAGAPHLALRLLDAQPGPLARSHELHLAAPTTLAGGWQLDPQPVALWKPAFKNPAAEINRSYLLQGREVGVYVGYYRRQGPKHKLVSSDNALVDAQGTGWAQVSTGIQALKQNNGEPTEVRTARLRLQRGAVGAAASDNSGLLVWQTYWINGRLTPSDVRAKLYGALDRLTGRGDDSAVVIFYTREQPAEARAAQALLASFAQANLATINARLAAVRGGE